MDTGELYLYSPGEMDWLLLNWMTRMKHDGELNHTFSIGMQTPLAFLQFFHNRYLLFKTNELMNITYAAWFEPCMKSAFLGFYISPDVRHQHEEKVFFLYDILNAAFERDVPVIVGLVQERATRVVTQKFINLHVRLGYTYMGAIPFFFDGEHCHCVFMTKLDWENNDGRWKKRWLDSRRQQEQSIAKPGRESTVIPGDWGAVGADWDGHVTTGG